VVAIAKWLFITQSLRFFLLQIPEEIFKLAHVASKIFQMINKLISKMAAKEESVKSEETTHKKGRKRKNKEQVIFIMFHIKF